MKQIPLTQGKYTLVDDEDYKWLMQWKWCAIYYPKEAVYRAIGNRGQKKPILMSRFIMNAPKDMVVDHKSGNTLNNCRSNLRICTKTQNNRNRKSQTKSLSKYKGVSWGKG